MLRPSDDDHGIHVLRDATAKPQGVLPRRTQQYIILGLALLIVLIALFSGHPANPASPSQARSLPDPRSPNPAEINAYERQLQQLQLANEHASLERAARAQAAPLAPEAAPAFVAGEPAAAEMRQPNPLAQQQQKLRYESLFASNIALSYRRPSAANAPRPAASSREAQIEAQISQLLWAQGPAAVGAKPATAPALKNPAPSQRPAGTPKPATASHRAGLHVLVEGTIIPTVLLNRLVGDLPGPVECMVASDVYGPDRQHVLIPSGARVLGEARPVSAFGQRRLAVTFDRLILPNGASYELGRYTGLNASGATGLHDQVNSHYWRIFGASMAIGLVGGAAEITAAPSAVTGRGLFIEGVGTGLSQASMQVLDKFLNIMPTITIREGHRVAIYLTHDLLLPAYHARGD